VSLIYCYTIYLKNTNSEFYNRHYLQYFLERTAVIGRNAVDNNQSNIVNVDYELLFRLWSIGIMCVELYRKTTLFCIQS